MQVRAQARNVAVSPKKIRLLLNQLPGRGVNEILARLRHMPSPHARVVAKLVRSAAANAENNYQIDPRYLRVVTAYAGDAPTLKRWRARSRGRASPILKRRSHVTVIVEEVEG
ncbi:MAG: 50S ribosomal protein L22 [Dehalococcoidia bacterium SM23_28_2]|nr:MAG: 50S ribosomal protein L22 [Dehalococcoidia bacterium SM23_28_2]